MTNMTTPSRLNWRNYYTHALPVPVHWQTDFTPKRAFAFTRYRSETSSRSEVVAPMQQLRWTHASMTCAGMTFCCGIVPREGTGVNLGRRESGSGPWIVKATLRSIYCGLLLFGRIHSTICLRMQTGNELNVVSTRSTGFRTNTALHYFAWIIRWSLPQSRLLFVGDSI